MAIIEDWVARAAHIVVFDYEGRIEHKASLPDRERIADIIRMHCPFKFDIAYEPVQLRRSFVLKCIDCGKLTTATEATLRVFFNGRCSCGGGFTVIEVKE